MPITIYTYLKPTDFPGGEVCLDNLENEIKASAVTTVLNGISAINNTVHIVFADALTPQEKTVLDGDISAPAGGLIAAHNNIPLPPFRDESEGIYIEETYTLNKLTKKTTFATKTAPKIFADKVKEITFTYVANYLTSMTTKRFRTDGTVGETVVETLSTEIASNESTIQRKER
jgi:hypothetical protein